MIRAIFPMILVTAGLVLAAELEIGKQIVTRNDTLRAVLKLPKALAGQGTLTLHWTDSYGRTVAVDKQNVRVSGRTVSVSVPLDRAVALHNFLKAELTVGETTVSSGKTEFTVTPESPKWDDYQIIMYYAYKRPAQQWALRDVGITAGKISSGGARTWTGGSRWYRHDYRFYVDQISTFFYAAYHTPRQTPKNKMYILAKEAYAKDRSSKKPFYREPCFHDEKALAGALENLQKTVRMQMRFRPFFYAHTDEGGVADLVASWDFCFDPRTLAAMRKWLMEQYGSLEAINKQWGTSFKALDEVVPLSTDEMMARGDDNFSPWADHRTFMNETFAGVLKAGTRAVEQVDPDARAGLVGCQMPAAFGGYDYWLLSQAMTAIEPYNIGNNREIWRSFAPEKPAVTTAFGFGDMEVWRLWYQFLHGDRGIIIYDEKYRYLDAQGKPTKLGTSIAPTYKELTGGLGKQLAYMQRVNDPVAIHYSHPSITAHWMYEVRPSGKRWVNRSSGTERKTSDFLRLRESVLKLLEDTLRQYYFVSYEQLEDGAFDKMDAKVLVLPQSIAMSKAECDAVRRFVARGGTVIADCRTALMDEHCKLLDKGQLDDLFGIRRKDTNFAPGPPGLTIHENLPAKVIVVPAMIEGIDKSRLRAAEPGIELAEGGMPLYRDANGTPAVVVRDHGKGKTAYLNLLIKDYHRWRLKPPEGEGLRRQMTGILQHSGVGLQCRIFGQDGFPVCGLELHPWQCGDLRTLGIHRNYQLRVSELGPPEYRSQAALEKPMQLKLDLGKAHAVYDQRAGKYLGKRRNLSLDLPKYEPLILSILPEPVDALTITGPAEAKPGELIAVKLALKGEILGDTHALRVRVFGPDRKELRILTRTLAADKGKVTWQVPIAASDPAGEYRLVVRDMATGVSAEHKLTVK
jgi:hypothetical protein